MIPMPFKPSTAKKYARLMLKWVLPIAFALIVLNGAYRGFTEPKPIYDFYLALYAAASLVACGLIVVCLLVWIIVWTYSSK